MTNKAGRPVGAKSKYKYHFLDDKVFNRRIKKPYCGCRGSYAFNGIKMHISSSDGMHLKLTKSSDGDTCDFCEYYVHWASPDDIKQGRKKGKNKYN